jgi:demethylmenaquinone methyltransferase/2-methoxy-6-polyprenyl-1,4-benzoquinol methylase
MTTVPDLVSAACDLAAQAGFEYSCDARVGQLLSVLAAAAPRDGRILELGTGAGVGTAWLVHGLGERTDVEMITVEVNRDLAAFAQRQVWPSNVTFVVADAVQVVPSLGQFDLVFADAPGGKWERLDLSIAALSAGGFLLVDDMSRQEWWSKDQAVKQTEVRQALLGHRCLASCELDYATGVVLSARRA